MSPLSRVPLLSTFSTPPRRRHSIALLINSWPCMDGASDFARRLKMSFLLFFTKFLHLVMSSRDIDGFASLLSCVRLFAITIVL